MGLGDEVGKEAIEELNRDLPQWLMQLRQVAMDVIDYAASYELVIGWRKKEKP
jgi:hypothetical protein